VRKNFSYRGHRVQIVRDLDDNGAVLKTIVIDGVRFPYVWAQKKPLGPAAWAKHFLDDLPVDVPLQTAPAQKVISAKFG